MHDKSAFSGTIKGKKDKVSLAAPIFVNSAAEIYDWKNNALTVSNIITIMVENALIVRESKYVISSGRKFSPAAYSNNNRI